MSFQGKELGLRGRLRVATPTIIGGVVALLMVAIVACDDAQPETTAESTISSPGPTASSTLTPTETPALLSVSTDGSDATASEPPFSGLEKRRKAVYGDIRAAIRLAPIPRSVRFAERKPGRKIKMAPQPSEWSTPKSANLTELEPTNAVHQRVLYS